MKKNLKIYIPIVISTLILLVGCSKENTTKIDSAQTVVQNYFYYKNEKNKDKLLTVIRKDENSPWLIDGMGV